jgi:hypothetical protein
MRWGTSTKAHIDLCSTVATVESDPPINTSHYRSIGDNANQQTQGRRSCAQTLTVKVDGFLPTESELRLMTRRSWAPMPISKRRMPPIGMIGGVIRGEADYSHLPTAWRLRPGRSVVKPEHTRRCAQNAGG